MLRVNDYDVVLMYVQMPEMDRYEATRRIRKGAAQRSDIPIIAMPANVMKTEVERSMDAGMDGSIPKPFKQEQLVEAINAVLKR